MKAPNKKRRDLVDLSGLTLEITSRVMQIDYWKKDNSDCLPAAKGTHQVARPKASAHTQSVKEKQYKRAATHILNQLYNSKSKNKTSKLELSTYHRYLTRIKNTIRSTVARHNPALPEIVADLQASYPKYSDLIGLLLTDDKKHVSKVKSYILSELSKLDAVDADDLHAEISALSKSGKIEHPVIKYLALTEAQQQRRKDEIAKRLKARKSDKQDYSLGFISRITDECLSSDDFNELALGVALATGRRAIEIIYRGTFAAHSKNEILFGGQTKKGKGVKVDAYIVPTLVEASAIVDAVEKLRATDKYNELLAELSEVPEDDKNRLINIKCARMLNVTAKRQLDPDTHPNESKVQFKDTRVIALQVAIAKIMPTKKYKSLDINEFTLRFQGHDDYNEFANYQHIAVADKPEEVKAPEEAEAPAIIDLDALEAVDDVINLSGKKTLYKLHERVKQWAVRTGAEITQTSLYKGVQGDKAGGSLALIKAYLAMPEVAEAVASHNDSLR